MVDLEEIPRPHDTITATGEMRVPQRSGDPTVRSGGLPGRRCADIHRPRHVDNAALLVQVGEVDDNIKQPVVVNPLPSTAYPPRLRWPAAPKTRSTS